MKDGPVSAESILHRALLNGLITIDEWHMPAVKSIAKYTAEWANADWPEHEGFGSSDMTTVLEGFLRRAGFDTAYVAGRLTRLGAR